jgi:hypothetical protein
VKDVGRHHVVDVARDVRRESRIDFAQHVATIIQTPHLAGGLIADATNDALDLLQHRVDGIALVVPVPLLHRQAVEHRGAVVVGKVGQNGAVGGFVLHVIHAGANVDDGLDDRMDADVPETFTILRPGAVHRCRLFRRRR